MPGKLTPAQVSPPRVVSTATYNFSPEDRVLAVQHIERSSVDREKAGTVMLVAGYLLAAVAGGLLVHLASIYNGIVLWLDKPMTILGILFSLSTSIWALRRSNKKTIPITKEMLDKGHSTVRDGFGDWWLLNTQTGEPVPIKIR